jgi:hypothetical protein
MSPLQGGAWDTAAALTNLKGSQIADEMAACGRLNGVPQALARICPATAGLHPIPPPCVHRQVGSNQQLTGFHGGAIVAMIVDHQDYPRPMKLDLGIEQVID